MVKRVGEIEGILKRTYETIEIGKLVSENQGDIGQKEHTLEELRTHARPVMRFLPPYYGSITKLNFSTNHSVLVKLSSNILVLTDPPKV